MVATKGDPQDPILHLPMSGWLGTCSDGYLSNPQTSWLLTRARVAFDNPFAPVGRPVSTGASLSRDPEAAVRMLEGLMRRSVVGVTDDLHGLYLEACRAMEWQPLHREARVENVSNAPSELLDLTVHDVGRIERLNVLDRYAYDLAGSLAGQR